MVTYCLHADVDLAFAKSVNPEDVLTFDDGHYNVYAARHELSTLPNRKVIFITPSYVAPESRETPPRREVYYQYDRVFNSNSQFMTLSEITELLNLGFELGMHSFYHDLVYVDGQTPVDRYWRMHKLAKTPLGLTALCRMYGTTSALAEPGVDRVDGLVRRRTQTEFAEFVARDTELCVEWFAKNLFVPNAYAFPFFIGSELLLSELSKYKITNVLGRRPRPVMNN